MLNNIMNDPQSQGSYSYSSSSSYSSCGPSGHVTHYSASSSTKRAPGGVCVKLCNAIDLFMFTLRSWKQLTLCKIRDLGWIK